MLRGIRRQQLQGRGPAVSGQFELPHGRQMPGLNRKLVQLPRVRETAAIRAHQSARFEQSAAIFARHLRR